jgi:DNA-binding NarL/FixJ family response regulator
MPGSAAPETLAAVRKVLPDIRVLVLTAYDDDAYVRSTINLGVDGYLLKDEATEALVRAITTIAEGGTWFSRVVLQKFVNPPSQGETIPLTPRELALMSGIAQGWDNRKMALEYDLAEQTVRNYISRIYEKVGVRSRAEAVVWARKNGYAGE